MQSETPTAFSRTRIADSISDDNRNINRAFMF